MQNIESVEPALSLAATVGIDGNLDFLWLELTNSCNLQCVHCYTESHPKKHERDLLTKDNYHSIMLQAYALGCRKIQFIGGEPQLNRDFHSLLRTAKDIGFEFIEVFSNLTFLDEETLGFAANNEVCFATSVYSDIPAHHNAVTKVATSHARTVGNLKRLIANRVVTRAGIIIIDQDDDEIDRTKKFLEGIGVGSIRISAIREFGRGEQVLSRSAQLSGLCGHCWKGKLAVAPDGIVYPCVMARQWSVGNIFENSLAEIVRGQALKDVRKDIYDSAWLTKAQNPRKNDPRDARCHPDCSECCEPDGCPETPCAPGCCPQSCVPDLPQ